MLQRQFCRTNYQVIGDVDRTTYVDLGSFRKIEFNRKRVVEADRLKDGSKLVKTVEPPVENPEIEVEFGERGDSNPHDSVLNQRKDILTRKLLAAVQGPEFNHEAEADHPAFEQVDEAGDRSGRTSRRENIIDDKHVLPGFDRIGVNFELVSAVFEIVLDAFDQAGELFRLTHRNEACAQGMSHRRGEKVSARLNSDHNIDGHLAVMVLQGVDGFAKTVLIFQKGGDVVKGDAGFGKIRNFTDQLLEMILNGRSSSEICRHARDFTAAAAYSSMHAHPVRVSAAVQG